MGSCAFWARVGGVVAPQILALVRNSTARDSKLFSSVLKDQVSLQFDWLMKNQTALSCKHEIKFK